MDDDAIDAAALAYMMLDPPIVWQSNGAYYRARDIKDDHLRNIIVMTIESSHWNVVHLRREAIKRKLFLADGWKTYNNEIIPSLARQYAKSDDELDRGILADILEEHGSPLHEWIRKSPSARSLAQNIRKLGDPYA